MAHYYWPNREMKLGKSDVKRSIYLVVLITKLLLLVQIPSFDKYRFSTTYGGIS